MAATRSSLTPRPFTGHRLTMVSGLTSVSTVRRHIEHDATLHGLPTLVGAILGAGLITASLIFFVWVKMAQVQAGYAIHALQTEAMKQRQERSSLEVEVSALRRPERLRQIAVSRLGMAPPKPEQLLRLSPSTDAVRAAAVSTTDKGDAQ